MSPASSDVEQRLATLVRDFRRSVGARGEGRVHVETVDEPGAVEIEVDGVPYLCPPARAQRVAAALSGGPGVPPTAPSQVWARLGPQRAADYVVELVGSIRTEQPELLCGAAGWSAWLDRCAKSVDLVIEPGYIGELTQTADPQDRELFPWLRTSLHEELGLQLPSMGFIPDPALPPRSFAVKINGLRTTPYLALEPDVVLSNRPVGDATPSTGHDGVPALLPGVLREGSLVAADRRGELEEMGYTTWTGRQYLVLCVAAELRSHAAWLLDPRVTEGMLTRLQTAYPVVTAAARERLDLAVLTQMLAELLASRLSVRRLRTILEALLEQEAAAYREATRVVRDRLAPAIAAKFSPSGRLRAWLLDPRLLDGDGDLTSAGAAVRLTRAVQSAIDAVPSYLDMPVLLVPEHVRVAAERILRVAAPQTGVLSYDDLPAGHPVEVVGRLLEPFSETLTDGTPVPAVAGS